MQPTDIQQATSPMFADRKKPPGPCPDHGEFEATYYPSRIPAFSFWSQCPACDRDIEREQLAWSAKTKIQDAETLRVQRLDAAGIPEMYRSMTLDDYQDYTTGQKRALTWARSYVRTFSEALKVGRGCILVGRKGTGKTMLCACIASALLGVGRTVMFSTLRRMSARVRATYDAAATEREAQAIDAFERPELLVLDEVGAHAGSQAEQALVFDVLNARYESRRPTLIVSNLTMDELDAFLGGRVTDRLRQDGKTIVFDWDSYRTKK